MRFIDRFEVLLLDMNGTFMFGHDRFGPEEEYFATYCRLGGERMHRELLQATMHTTCESLLRIYETPTRYDDFPTLREAFAEFGCAMEEDLAVLERVFAAHEIGTVPASHARFLQQVGLTHSLGLVSNICAHPDLWLRTCESAAVFECFTTRVFSSEGRSIKPSAKLFRRALEGFPSGSRVLFVGDSLERDIIPAKAIGLSTVWIAPPGSAHTAADRVITSLPDLELAV